MGRKWKLRDTEWDALDHLRFGTTDAEVFRNATLILMTAVGRSKNLIADDLGCIPGTVDNVRKRYRDRGLEGLKRRKPPGPEPSDRRISRRLARGDSNSTADTRLWFQRLVGRATRRSLLERKTGIAFDGRSRAAYPCTRKVFPSSGQSIR